MNPRAEAMDRLGGAYEARVLEPSPPAVTEPPFADDPIAPGEVPEGRQLVSPVANRGDVTWDDLCKADSQLGPWCAERWLGAWRRLEPLPDTFGDTRAALHELAEQVIAPARKPDNEIALRYTRCGFGTPFFDEGGQDCQVRVQHGALVRQRGASEDRDEIQGVDIAAAHALGDFYGFACSVLEELRAEESDGDPSLVQLWPEHFDLAFELGSEAKGERANLGASPGDEDHPEPYIYVGPWDAAKAEGEGWNGAGFKGAELPYAELLEAPDQRRAAIDFMFDRLRALAG